MAIIMSGSLTKHSSLSVVAHLKENLWESRHGTFPCGCIFPCSTSINLAASAGGGSGHEPLAAGLVGPGLLSAAVCGDVFASPSAESILATLRAVTGQAGCLLLVMNYTGVQGLPHQGRTVSALLRLEKTTCG